MRRRLMNAATLVSLLLCIVTAMLWVHSRRGWDGVLRCDERRLANSDLWFLVSSRGSVWIYHERYDARARQNRGPRLYWRVEAASPEPPLVLFNDPTWGSGDEFRHRWPAWRNRAPRQSGRC